ncbi:RNA polymerase II C-terminal domain phosphatase-like 1 [Sesamum angolense]|uniref:protein-serine/threonine phosphatase n=1 Tax=Sesamum angolense TaxID=2727404 RepID=A0AAE1W4I3_9LAMI|nr:RNA polymerase II C-terminal domain phosphatase-like 1 [Sesamum angolense]
MYGKLVLVYEGERLLGEVELQHQGGGVWGEEIKEIRISHYSPPSERCPPLAVLHTINSTGICFKLESTAKNVDSPLSLLHATCLRDNKIRDTSVLVRLRPAWEDLKAYLTAKGRKRFEVFVCTMAERDYALEMWRLLDPESSLINPRDLLDRIVCVKSGSRKSLFNVFQDGNCHPKMALVIDDRLKVWDEKDQPRVHVVPAFAPYFAPQAEANNSIPVLCLARNVACNVRGGFFKEFDESLIQRISGVAFEDDIKDMPSPPDVSNYLFPEDDPLASNGNKDAIGFDGMADAEVERRLKESMSASSTAATPTINLDPRIASAIQFAVPSSSFTVHPPKIQGPAVPFLGQQLPPVTTLPKPPLAHIGQGETTFHSSPAREEGEVPESELDPDTRRRLLILQHGQDMREHPPSEPQFPARPPMQVPVPRVHPRGWFPIEEEMSPRQLKLVTSPMEFNAESLPIDKHRTHRPPFLHKVDTSVPPGRVVETPRLPKEEIPRENLLRLNQPLPDSHSFSSEDSAMAQLSSANEDLDLEAGQIDPYGENSTEALQDIAFKCGTKVEFKQALVSSTELQFSVKERELVKELVEQEGKHSGTLLKHLFYIWLCNMEGLGVAFQTRPQFSSNRGQKTEVYAEVEIDGQVLGKGIGLTWDEAKSQAAEKALGALKSMLGQFPYKRPGSPSECNPQPGTLRMQLLVHETSSSIDMLHCIARSSKSTNPCGYGPSALAGLWICLLSCFLVELTEAKQGTG